MYNFRLPSAGLAVLVSAPALLAGRLAAGGDYARAGYVAALELLVILIAGAIAAQRRLE
jgi:hypothetical protein